MIYLDSSVALAQLYAEDRFPPEDLWHQQLISSRFLEYEVWNRIHARRTRSVARRCSASANRPRSAARVGPAGAGASVGPVAIAVRTLDALHLSLIEFLRRRREQLELASYDEKANHRGACASYSTLWCLTVTRDQKITHLSSSAKKPKVGDQLTPIRSDWAFMVG